MVSAIDSALSGLNAASKKLEVSANNIANQFSTKTSTNGQASEHPFVAQKVDQVSLSGGGVQTKVNSTNQPVDQAQELVTQDIASYNFKANLKVIKVQDDIDQSLLDIKT